MRLLQRAEEEPLHEPEHVPRTQHDAEHGEDGDGCELHGHVTRGVSKGALKAAEEN